MKVSVALTAPATWGLKVTVYGVLCPAGIVTGSDSPPTLKTELFDVAAVTVTFAPACGQTPGSASATPDNNVAKTQGGRGGC